MIKGEHCSDHADYIYAVRDSLVSTRDAIEEVDGVIGMSPIGLWTAVLKPRVRHHLGFWPSPSWLFATRSHTSGLSSTKRPMRHF